MTVLVAASADEWQHVVSDCFVPLSCQAFESDFRGRMEYRRLDSTISVSRVTTSGTTASRTPRLASTADSDDVHLSLQASSTGTVIQDGRRVAVRPGSVTSYATDAAYHLDYSAPEQQQVIVQVSRRALQLPAKMVAASCERLLVPASPARRILFSYVSSLHGSTEQEVENEQTAAVTRDLAAAMIHSSFSSGRVMPSTPGGLLFTVQDFIQHHLGSAALGTDRIADAHFISRRKLYQLFEPLQTSPAEYLRRTRLTAAAELLMSEPTSRVHIADIAARCGFADATTFTRAFRREFGCTPREWRSRERLVDAPSSVLVA